MKGVLVVGLAEALHGSTIETLKEYVKGLFETEERRFYFAENPQNEAFQNSAGAIECPKTRDFHPRRGRLPLNGGSNGEKEDSDGRGKGRTEKASNSQNETGSSLRSGLGGDPGETSTPDLLAEGGS